MKTIRFVSCFALAAGIATALPAIAHAEEADAASDKDSIVVSATPGVVYIGACLAETAKFDEFKDVFETTVRSLRLHNPSHGQKQLGLTLVDGTEVGPAEMSEGMLYWLAFAIIEHLSPRPMILIEEPENGLHPARIVEVMRVLRDGEAPVYHLHFDCQPGRIFAVPEAALRALEVTAHV